MTIWNVINNVGMVKVYNKYLIEWIWILTQVSIPMTQARWVSQQCYLASVFLDIHTNTIISDGMKPKQVKLDLKSICSVSIYKQCISIIHILQQITRMQKRLVMIRIHAWSSQLAANSSFCIQFIHIIMLQIHLWLQYRYNHLLFGMINTCSM